MSGEKFKASIQGLSEKCKVGVEPKEYNFSQGMRDVVWGKINRKIDVIRKGVSVLLPS